MSFVWCIHVYFYLIFGLLCSAEKEETKSKSAPAAKKQNGGTKKRLDRKKEPKHTFSHAWLASSLKGHSQQILGLDFSPNGKYMATCAEGLPFR